MNPILLLLVLGGGWLMLKGSKADNGASAEAPKDANTLLATVLSPSMTDLGQLGLYFNSLVTAVGNATTPQVTLRLSLYALVTRLKYAMLVKGATPNADELMAIAYAPSSGMGGLQKLADVPGADVQQAVYAALSDSQQDPAAIGAYVDAALATKVGGKRMVAYELAMKAKQIMLQSGVTFKSPVYFAIANMSNVPQPAANSILFYK